METVYILWQREVKRYIRSRTRIVGSLGQPILFLIALGFGLGPVFQRAGAGNYIQFLAPGIVAMSILFTSIFSGIQIIWDRQFGFLKETLVAPVSRFEIVLGKTLGGATVATFQGIIVLVLSLFAGFRPYNIVLLPLTIMCMFLMALLFTALGTAVASRLNDMQGFQLVMNFLVQPLFFLSGSLFPLSGLPKALTIVAAIDPLSYGVDGLRYTLSGASHYGLGIDIGVLAILAIIFLAAGSFLFSKIEV